MVLDSLKDVFVFYKNLSSIQKYNFSYSYTEGS